MVPSRPTTTHSVVLGQLTLSAPPKSCWAVQLAPPLFVKMMYWPAATQTSVLGQLIAFPPVGTPFTNADAEV